MAHAHAAATTIRAITTGHQLWLAPVKKAITANTTPISANHAHAVVLESSEREFT